MHLQLRTKISLQKTSSSNCWNNNSYWPYLVPNYWK